jgi:DNA-binding IclR family transcriptional regulator
MGRPVKEKSNLSKELRAPSGTQTLLRGLDVLELIAEGPIKLEQLSETLGLNRSTAHRLAATLIARRYMNFTPRDGYVLGPKLMELGFRAQQQNDLVYVARPYLEEFAAKTGDTVHFGILDGTRALYLEKIPGRRPIEISSRVGDRQPLRSTGLGKALLLDETEARWIEFYNAEDSKGAKSKEKLNAWLKQMKTYAAGGYTFDLEENEDHINCVAAPVRDVTGGIVGALSCSSAVQYMDAQRLTALVADAKAIAAAISRDLGWTGKLARSKR